MHCVNLLLTVTSAYGVVQYFVLIDVVDATQKGNIIFQL